MSAQSFVKYFDVLKYTRFYFFNFLITFLSKFEDDERSNFNC